MVLPNIKINPSGSSQCTSPKHPVSCIISFANLSLSLSYLSLQCWPSQNNDLHFFKFHLPTSHPHLRDFSSDLIPESHKLNSSGLLYTFHWMSSNSVYYKLKSTPFTWDPSCFYLRNSLKFQDQWLKVSLFGFTASSALHPWKQPHCSLYPQQLLHHPSIWAHSSVHWRGHLFSWSPVALLTHCLYIKFGESDNHF